MKTAYACNKESRGIEPVSKNTNVIELNGIAYDALTGAAIGRVKRPEHRVQAAAMKPRTAPAAAHRVSMDGMVQSSAHAPHLHIAKQPHQAAHLKPHHPQPTKTLMRRAVKAPQKAKQQFQVVAPLKPGVPQRAAVQPKLSSYEIDPRRAQRATQAQRSQLVQHFTPQQPAPARLQPAQAQPVQVMTPAQAPAIAPPVAPVQSPMTNRQRTQQQAAVRQAHPSYVQPMQPAQAPAISSDEDDDLFAQALAHATSHEQLAPHESGFNATKRKGKKHRKALSIAASLALFIALFGFVAYQNKANIQLQLASARAGFSASVPLYKPDGYKMDQLSSQAGAVAVSYINDNSNRIDISQKRSNWDSQTLLENFVVTSNEPYEGYQAGGRTIYVYGKGKATWVNGGIWYQLSGADNLTNEQIVKVAESM